MTNQMLRKVEKVGVVSSRVCEDDMFVRMTEL